LSLSEEFRLKQGSSSAAVGISLFEFFGVPVCAGDAVSNTWASSRGFKTQLGIGVAR
jgi:hypothetical protein